MAAITTFNRRATEQQGETGAKGRKHYSPKKEEGERGREGERGEKRRKEKDEEGGKKEIGSDLSVVLPVSGERSPSFPFVCLCLILKGWMLSGRAIQTGVLGGVAEVIFHVTELGRIL